MNGRGKWWIACSVLGGLFAAYALAWVVTEGNRRDAQASFQAAIDEARAANEAAFEREQALAPVREVVSIEEVWNLMAPFGEALIQDSTWKECSTGIDMPLGWPESSMAEARAWLDAISTTTLASAREVADRRIALDSSVSPDVTTLSPRQFSEAGRLLLLSAIMALTDGNTDAAFVDLVRVLDIADAAGTARPLIWQLVRVSLWNSAVDVLPALLPTLSKDKRDILRARLEAAQGREAMVAGLTEELSLLMELAPTMLNTAKGRIARPWMNVNLSIALTDTLPLLDALSTVRDPAATVAPSMMPLAPPPPSGMPLLYRLGQRFRASFYQTFHMALEDQAAHEASMRLASVALALWEQREQPKGLPETLKELEPRVGALTTTDPFTQKPLVYHRFGNSFVLYSAGPNGMDDRAPGGRQGDDIIWGGN